MWPQGAPSQQQAPPAPAGAHAALLGRAWDLLRRCHASPDPLVRQTAVLALVEGLADSEALSMATLEAPLPAGLLCGALLPLAEWMHPEDVAEREGTLWEWARAARGAAEAEGGGAGPQRRGRKGRPAAPRGGVRGEGAAQGEWQGVMRALEAQRAAFPGVACPAALISLWDTAEC